jgi:hypothetical protein
MSRGVNLSERQLKELLRQAPTNAQAANAAARGQYEADIETTIVRAMQLDGWRSLKQEYSFDTVKKLTLGEPGMCDHLFLRPKPILRLEPLIAGDIELPMGWIQGIWWEFKASKRRRKRKEFLSRDQVLWTDCEKRAGFLVWIAGIDHEATIDGAAQHYLDSGFCRNRAPFVALIPPEGRGPEDRPQRLGE